MVVVLLVVVLAWISCDEVLSQQAPTDFSAQYHIQTDLGAERFFRFQTHSGQYRKEKLNPDGSVEGTYGWVDPTGILRLYDYVADTAGYRIEKESFYRVGNPSPSAALTTRGGEIALGFEIYQLDGSPVNRQGGGTSGQPAQRLHITEGEFGATLPYQVSSLTSTDHRLNPNPVSLHPHATFFSGSPAAPPPPAPIVVGAEATRIAEPEPVQRAIVVGHTGDSPVSRTTLHPEEPVQRSGIVIGLSNNGGADNFVAAAPRPAARAYSPPPAPPATRTGGIVIGSTGRRRRRRFVVVHP